MTNLLRGVVQRGTARPPRRSTGRSPARPARWTTTPTRGSSASTRTSRSACGWATTRRSRSGHGETGAPAALPIWMDFMRAYIDKRGDREEPAAVRGARQHRVRDARLGHHRGVHQRHAAADDGRGRRRRRRSARRTCAGSRQRSNDREAAVSAQAPVRRVRADAPDVDGVFRHSTYAFVDQRR